MRNPGRLYMRPLPGGGFVSIESAGTGPGAVRAILIVERRADPARRLGHAPPVVAEATAENTARALDALFSIASNNVEIARALQRWRAVVGQ